MLATMVGTQLPRDASTYLLTFLLAPSLFSWVDLPLTYHAVIFSHVGTEGLDTSLDVSNTSGTAPQVNLLTQQSIFNSTGPHLGMYVATASHAISDDTMRMY